MKTGTQWIKNSKYLLKFQDWIIYKIHKKSNTMKNNSKHLKFVYMVDLTNYKNKQNWYPMKNNNLWQFQTFGI